jgi:hypothetical protein
LFFLIIKFDIAKIELALHNIVYTHGPSGTNPDNTKFESQMQAIAPFLEFIKKTETGFEPTNSEFYGSVIKSLNFQGLFLNQLYLSENPVLYAGIVRGAFDSTMNLFMIIEVGKYAYSINTSLSGTERDSIHATQKVYSSVLMKTINLSDLYFQYIAQPIDLGFRGNILQCKNRFASIMHNLPDAVSDGSVKWTKANIIYLQSLINSVDIE